MELDMASNIVPANRIEYRFGCKETAILKDIAAKIKTADKRHIKRFKIRDHAYIEFTYRIDPIGRTNAYI